MNAEAITNRILKDANAAAAETLRAAHERAAEIERASDERAEKERVSTLEAARKEGEGERANMLRMAELDERKSLLAMKREVLDEVFAQAIRRMAEMDDETQKAFLLRLAQEACEGDARLIVNDRDARLYDDAFLARLCAETGHSITVSPERRPIAGGFLLVSGGAEINCAYESVVREARASLEGEAARLLFE